MVWSEVGGREGRQDAQHSTTVAQLHSSRFLNFISSRMGRLCQILSTHLCLDLPNCLLSFSHQYPICIPVRLHSCCMPCLSHHPWCDHSNYNKRIIHSVSEKLPCIILLMEIVSWGKIVYGIFASQRTRGMRSWIGIQLALILAGHFH
jgi:hypothetical protein